MIYIKKYHIPDFNIIKYNDNYIFNLIKLNEIKKLDFYLSLYPNEINTMDDFGNTPLFYAIYKNNFELTQLLIKYKSDINHHNKEGISPLLLSLQNDSINIIRLLIQNKVNINDLINDIPIFFYTIIFNNYNAFIEFLDNNININQLTTNNKSALFYTISELNNHFINTKYNNYIYAYILIQYKIDINSKDIFGKSVLCDAILKNNIDIINLLICNNADINIFYNDIDTPLFYAIKNNNYDLVQLLINHKVNINKKNKNNELPLIYAIKHNQIKIVKLLLNSGCYIPKYIKMIINNIRYYIPIIIYTIKYCNSIISVLLIEHSVQIDYVDKYDNNLLYYAIIYDKPKVVAKLYEENININHINSLGKSIVHYISNTKNGNIILSILLNNDIDFKTVKTYLLSRYLIHYNIEFILLITNKIKINFNNKYKIGKYDNLTVLHLAALNKHSDVLLYFLNKNMNDINNDNNKYKLTPLLCGVLSNNIKNIELLLLKGADINKIDYYGNNIIQFAEKHKIKKKVIDFIKKYY